MYKMVIVPILLYFYSIATIRFDQPVHFAAENGGMANPMIILQSDVLGSRSITVEVFSTDGSAIGDCDVIIILLYD